MGSIKHVFSNLPQSPWSGKGPVNKSLTFLALLLSQLLFALRRVKMEGQPSETNQEDGKPPQKSAPLGRRLSQSPVKSILSRAQSLKSQLISNSKNIKDDLSAIVKIGAIDDKGDDDDVAQPQASDEPAFVDVNVNADEGKELIQRICKLKTEMHQDRTISVRIQGGTLVSSPRKGRPKQVLPRRRRRQTSVEREVQERIDRENRILLRKILEQHHGVRRISAIPPPPTKSHRKKYPLTNGRDEMVHLEKARDRPTSNQINQNKKKHKTDYENLLLLQKIQNARPSRAIEQSFVRMRL